MSDNETKLMETLVINISQEAADTCGSPYLTTDCLLATSIKLQFPDAKVSAGFTCFEMTLDGVYYEYALADDDVFSGAAQVIYGQYESVDNEAVFPFRIKSDFVPFELTFNMESKRYVQI